MRRHRLPLLLSVLLCAAALSLPAPGPLPGAAAASADGVAEHGLKGEYFRMSAPGARDFAELGGVALEPRIELPGLASVFTTLTGRDTHTTARWTGRIEARETGDHTFSAAGDDGFRLFIDGEPVIDHWTTDGGGEQHSAPVALKAGEKHDIRLEMFQDTGASQMALSWAGPSGKKEIVPESALTPPPGHGVHPVDLTVSGDGRKLRARFEGEVTGVGALRDHVGVEADTTALPVASVTPVPGDPRALTVGLSEPVQKGQRVRFWYDGDAGLQAGGEAVPQVMRHAQNASEHRLRTEWGERLDRANPLPEYPRPQERRERWQNLNGPWEFAGAEKGEEPVFGASLDERITVPFPVESQLSGLERHEDHMFYRKQITVPEDWSVGEGKRLRLHFGAVDHHARVWVNGEKVAEHKGGYTAFSADITGALFGDGRQEVLVAVTDTNGPSQPVGKQTGDPGGIFYTESSGIWQTVWMEPVPEVAVDRLVTTPKPGTDSLTVKVESQAASSGARVEAVARDAEGREVGSITGPAEAELRLPVPDPHLWAPGDPYLYDLDVTLTDGTSKDVVESYFGMRSLGVAEVGGHRKLVLNGKPFFSLAMLDQGFWPDGLYTQPADDALVHDLAGQKKLGFNAVRKHIKAEPARWYYHADRLGLLVWQDFVSGTNAGEEGRKAFLDEGRELMKQLHNSPSVGGWVVFNEGWGEWDREESGRIAESVKAADPSRVVNAHSGVNCCDSKGDSGKGDIVDHHDYDNTDPPSADHRAAMDGEHGGFTLRTPGHMWPGPPTVIYSGVADRAALTAKYVENTEQFYLRQAAGELSGSVYTQVTDLENELNGMWTYDRRELKVDPERVRAVNEKVIEAGRTP